MNKREIIGRLKRRYPEATKIFQDEYKHWIVEISELDGWYETFHAFAVRNEKLQFIGTTTCEY